MKITEIQIWNDDVIRMTDEGDYQYEVTNVRMFEMWLDEPTISAINEMIKYTPSLWSKHAIKVIDQMERPLDSQPRDK